MALLLAAKSTSSGSSFLIILILIAVVGYFLLLRPQQKKARRQREQQHNIGVGDEIVTVGGIKGTVVAMDDQHVTIVTGHDTVGFAARDSAPHRITLVRQAVSRKVEPVVTEPPGPDVEDAATGDVDEGFDDEEYAPGDGKAAEGGGAG